MTRSEGRRFGLVVGGAFTLLALLLEWRDARTAATIALALGALLVAGGLLLPTRMGPVERAWMGLATALSKVTTPIFMGIIYFLLMWPMGLARRIFGSNPLIHREVDGSYWKRRDPDQTGDMRRQF